MSHLRGKAQIRGIAFSQGGCYKCVGKWEELSKRDL